MSLNKYNIKNIKNIKLINKGSYGKIYNDVKSNHIIKEIYLFKNDTICSTTLRELNMYGLLEQKNIQSPYIIKASDIHFKEDKVYLIMENGGQTLTNWINQNLQNISKHIFNFFKCISHALYKINKLGYVHGDVKPDNIVISESLCPKLIDFGASIPYGNLTSFCMCTKLFKDPSLSEYNCIYNDKSDIFSLALVMGYMISQEYFIHNGNYDYNYFIKKIENTPYLTNETKKLIINMGNPNPEERTSFLDLSLFFDYKEDKEEDNKEEDISHSIVPSSYKFYIKNTLLKLNLNEYIDSSISSFERIYKEYKEEIEDSKLYVTITFILKIIFFDRMNINLNEINNFFSLPYTINDIKKSIIDIIVQLNLFLM